jgi:hypothetical protein
VEKKWHSYPSGLEKTLCKWEIYVPLVTKGLKAELNPICSLLGLLGAHHILHVSRIRVKKHWHP